MLDTVGAPGTISTTAAPATRLDHSGPPAPRRRRRWNRQAGVDNSLSTTLEDRQLLDGGDLLAALSGRHSAAGGYSTVRRPLRYNGTDNDDHVQIAFVALAGLESVGCPPEPGPVKSPHWTDATCGVIRRRHDQRGRIDVAAASRVGAGG